MVLRQLPVARAQVSLFGAGAWQVRLTEELARSDVACCAARSSGAVVRVAVDASGYQNVI